MMEMSTYMDALNDEYIYVYRNCGLSIQYTHDAVLLIAGVGPLGDKADLNFFTGG